MLLGSLVDATTSLANVRSAVEAVIPETVRITAADTTRLINVAPELSTVETAAAALDRPVREVLERAVAAAVETGLVPGGPAPAGGG